MAGFSDVQERAVVRQYFRNTTAPQPTSVYVALYTSDPTDADAGTEVTGGSYVRIAVSTGASGTGVGSGWTDPGASGPISTANTAPVAFPTPSANWGTITHIGLRDAVTAGNLIASAALSTPRVINNGDSAPSFATGALVFSLD